jgi:two-component system phosphate regulon response regulator PhoB
MAKILVVDDDADIRELVSMKLTNAGYDVIAEADGETGLAAVIDQRPDLVVLDWMMPGLTGIEVCRALRDDPRTVNTAVLLLTARAQEADIENGFAAGADDYIVKPFSARELATRVETLLARIG